MTVISCNLILTAFMNGVNSFLNIDKCQVISETRFLLYRITISTLGQNGEQITIYVFTPNKARIRWLYTMYNVKAARITFYSNDTSEGKLLVLVIYYNDSCKYIHSRI